MKHRCIMLGALMLLALCLSSTGWAAGEIATANVDAEEIGEFTQGYAPYYDDGLYGIVRYDGRVIIEPTYQDIGAYSEQLWPVQTEHGWQFINMDGTTAIAGPFESAEAFNFGISVISENGHYGAILPSGAYAIEPVWDYISAYNSMGVARALIGEQWTLLDVSGTALTQYMYDNIIEYDGALLGMRNGAYDLILSDGSIALTFAADEIGDCWDGYITYRVGDTWQLHDFNGELLWSRTGNSDSYMDPPVNGMARFCASDSCALFDVESGTERSGEDWAYVGYPTGGMISVKYASGEYGYVSLDGAPLTQALYQAASDFHYGYALVSDGVKWSVIDSKFDTVATLDGIPVDEFERMGFAEGYITVELEDGCQIVRITGSAIEGGEFTVENGLLTTYRGEGGDVHIPEGVKAIADELFNGRDDITSIHLPESLISIGDRAFTSCSNLTGTVFIPKSVSEIGEYAFSYTDVERFIVDESNITYLSWDGGLATLDGVFLCYPSGSDNAYYSLPYNTQYLEAYSFAGCTQLRYLNVPYSAAEQLDISSKAFDDNDSTYMICNIDTQAADAALDMELPLLTVYTTPEPTPVPTPTPTRAPTPSPTATPEPTGIPGKTMVYFNPNGVYYHTHSDCSGMRGAGYFTLDDAIAAGKRPCPVCNPPRPTNHPTIIPTRIPTEAPTQTPTPEPTIIPTATPEPTGVPGEIMVYYNPNGTYYHTTSNCSGMKGAQYHTLGEAIAAGKQPCPVCNPPVPTPEPTSIPTEAPTYVPTEVPTPIPTATPTATPAPTDVPGEIMVYYNPNGTYYHTSSDCSGMKGAQYHTLGEAIAAGKQPCPVCNPPVPTQAPTDEPIEQPTEEATEQPTPEVTPEATPEATPVITPPMFNADDLFAGAILPGTSTRTDVETALNAVALTEYASDTEPELTQVDYEFGYALYDGNGVLNRIQVQLNAAEPDNVPKLESVRGLSLISSVDDVLAAFYNPNGVTIGGDDLIYSDGEVYSAYTTFDPDTNLSSIAYTCQLDEENMLQLEFGFVDGIMQYMAMYLEEPIVG